MVEEYVKRPGCNWKAYKARSSKYVFCGLNSSEGWQQHVAKFKVLNFNYKTKKLHWFGGHLRLTNIVCCHFTKFFEFSSFFFCFWIFFSVEYQRTNFFIPDDEEIKKDIESTLAHDNENTKATKPSLIDRFMGKKWIM